MKLPAILIFCFFFGQAVSKSPNFDYDFTGFHKVGGLYATTCTNIKQQVFVDILINKVQWYNFK